MYCARADRGGGHRFRRFYVRMRIMGREVSIVAYIICGWPHSDHSIELWRNVVALYIAKCVCLLVEGGSKATAYLTDKRWNRGIHEWQLFNTGESPLNQSKPNYYNYYIVNSHIYLLRAFQLIHADQDSNSSKFNSNVHDLSQEIFEFAVNFLLLWFFWSFNLK